MMHGEVFSVGKLGSLLEPGSSGVLLLDCRGANDFNTCHIQGALHVLIPNLLLRRLKKGNLSVASVVANEVRDSFLSRWQSELVVLYDDKSLGKDISPTSEIGLLLQKLTKDGCRTCLLQGGFHKFQQEFPHLCSGKPSPSDDSSTIMGLSNLNLLEFSALLEKQPSPPTCNNNVFPVEVIPYLYLGNAQNSEDMECLRKHGIKYIVNVTPNVKNKFEGCSDIKYLQIPIDDHWSQTIAPFFNQAISFIDEGRLGKNGVLVHCLAGISRSVTVTVAYLMHALSLSLNEAYEYVRTKKSNISPNFNFMGQLLDFEKTLQAKDCGCACTKDAATAGATSTTDSKSTTTTITITSSSSTSSSSSSSTTPSNSSSTTSTSTMAPPGGCLCSCHQMKSYFSTPSSTTSNSSSTFSSFSYNSSPTQT